MYKNRAWEATMFKVHGPQDDRNSSLSYSATSADGSPLPAWLIFDVKRKTLSGTPQQTGTYLIQVTATDTAKATAVCTFAVKVE